MNNEYDVNEYLNRLTGQKADLLRFRGNFGDAVIHQGTKQIIKKSKINTKIIKHNDRPENEILIVDGGGNLVDYYSDVSNFIIKNGDFYSKIIILPHTIFGEKALYAMRLVEKKLTVFCRERISLDFVAQNIKSELYLWHDNAFEVNLVDYSNDIKKKSKLKAFRTDVESTLKRKPFFNRDLSQEGNINSDIAEFVNTIANYKSIHTDRLHIAITGALLGFQVMLYPNSYYKNKAIYEYSLIKFKNVKFALL